MDILKGYISDIEFIVPAGLPTATFTVMQNGEQVGVTGNAQIAGNVAKATLPYQAVFNDGELEVTLSYNFEMQSYEQTKAIALCNPILPLHEIGRIIEDDDENAQREIEASVRNIIQAHTGQVFGFYSGPLEVRGDGESVLALPRKLNSIRSINGVVISDDWPIRNDGWLISTKFASIYSREDSSVYQSSGVINIPWIRQPEFAYEVKYVIDGDWGWKVIPGEVQEAARLLINDYACGESAYRDRFLTSMTAADWRIQFNVGAYEKTGNVRADQLLSAYVLNRGIRVI